MTELGLAGVAQWQGMMHWVQTPGEEKYNDRI
jgi:hypothetical protein